ncbi:TPA: hypothetical protein ACQ49O_005455 [Klebsiella pneumoniae]|jgi:hypothetical protein|uniref:Conjugal transfer protein TraD n=22 Tax=Enterobacteriaceae TaxID=543 RepID=A0A8T3UL18_ECOLX|nr:MULTISPECIES: hypothetical protein [Gammaproteobacteria]EBF7093764.1 hypothetical protein [Salmonella enterica subsp. enterica serovar Liverpool]EBN9831181.1 hypothetical protein [Salmonella enterica subsp. enterica serovar Senftenberg]EBP4128497.1 hypothetical protein [Salmonella enterica subsp. enterica]EBQ6263022.1 hypothetical protein [Salmonella enterica subsp. enterica serovar Virchow]EBV6452236.1 hypothetical protein [Salmonella enterica subsp. enterica serovar Ohio]EBY8737601.1 hyp
MKTNENLLNSIGKSIRMWRDNCFPPFQRAYGTWLLVLVSVNAGIWFYITSDWSVQFVGNIAGLLVFPMLGRKVFTKRARSWQEELDIKLAKYKPHNIAAWRELQAYALESNTLSSQIVERWYFKEREFIKTAQKGKPGSSELKFLKNNTGSKP